MGTSPTERAILSNRNSGFIRFIIKNDDFTMKIGGFTLFQQFVMYGNQQAWVSPDIQGI